MKLKIKTKILIWYAISFFILISAYVVVTIIISSSTINRNANETIKHETEEIANDLEIEDDGLVIYKDDDEENTFRFLYDNIIYVIYHDNNLFAGETPASISEFIPINLYEIQNYDVNETTWLIYDVPIQSGYTLRAFYSTWASESTFNQVFTWMLIFTPIVVLISLSGGLLIIKRAFKPIYSITDTAVEISKEQNYNIRVDYIDTSDEVSDLAKTINQMLDSIEKAIEREKSFTSNVSHELRTPLSALRVQVEYLKDKNNQNNLNKNIDDILSQLEYMESLVNHLLEWVRSKQIKPSVYEPIDIVMVLQSVVESMSGLAENRNIQLLFNQKPSSFILKTDLSSLIRIFNNLISNAIKYNIDNGLIEISVEILSDSLVIEVKDTGIGMSESSLKKAFDPFFRVDSSRSEKESLGIGLSITKNLVENINGILELESVLNQGTIARVTFKI